MTKLLNLPIIMPKQRIMTIGALVMTGIALVFLFGPGPDIFQRKTTPVIPIDTISEVVADEKQLLVLDERGVHFTEAARLMAGMPALDPSTHDSLRNTKAWASHQSKFDTLWQRVERDQLSKIRPWASTELPERMRNATELFYPFSGPDFLYANLFFPKAKRIVMAGLEEPGDCPDFKNMPNNEWDQNLRGLDVSLDDILNVSFFRTIDMGKDFKVTRIKGIAPVLMLFMARTGHRIANVQQIACDTLGRIRNGLTLGVNEFPGVKISYFAEGETEMREVVYFSLNVTDVEYKRQIGFEKFVMSMEKPAGYIKSASYLMHNSYFSNIRNLMLNHCIGILEDDSGIPWKYWDKESWDIQLHGKYMVPIPLFANRYQTDLQKEYDTNPTVKALPFGIGYQYEQNKSNLLVAVSRKR